jgi:hypothetical protein
MKKASILLIALVAGILISGGCEKEEEIPPKLEFKTGEGYTSSDVTVEPGAELTVGIVATKTEDDLKTYNVSVAYDGSTTTTTVQNFTIPESEQSGYEKDVTFNARDVAGSEEYFFTITDKDGNIVQLTLTVTVK